MSDFGCPNMFYDIAFLKAGAAGSEQIRSRGLTINLNEPLSSSLNSNPIGLFQKVKLLMKACENSSHHI